MRLQLLDILIIVAYLVTMVMIGWFLRKKARQNKESYLLGGNCKRIRLDPPVSSCRYFCSYNFSLAMSFSKSVFGCW